MDDGWEVSVGAITRDTGSYLDVDTVIAHMATPVFVLLNVHGSLRDLSLFTLKGNWRFLSLPLREALNRLLRKAILLRHVPLLLLE
jgi:hypothetical protein